MQYDRYAIFTIYLIYIVYIYNIYGLIQNYGVLIFYDHGLIRTSKFQEN